MLRSLLPLLLLPATLAAQDTIPAFPEARGWGATTLAPCRSLPLVVHQVTNTDESGPGSLRAALEAQTDSTFDFVTFGVNGRIWLKAQENLIINDVDCLYIAGQTAPGDDGGIVITGNQFHFRPGGVATVDGSAGSDLLVRYLTLRKHRDGRFRVGLVYLDHISCAWSGSDGDGNCLGVGSRPDNPGEFDSMPWVWSMSNSLMFEPHENHPTHCHHATHRGTAFENVMGGPGHRECLYNTNRMASSGVEHVHNVGYNWFARGLSTARDQRIDIEANYYKRGPATDAVTPAYRRFPFLLRDNCPDEPFCSLSPFGQNNRSVENDFGLVLSVDSSFAGSQRQFACGVTGDAAGWCTSNGDPIPSDSIRSTPLPITADWPVERSLFTDAMVDEVLDRAGNYRGLACDGSWVERRDSMDAVAIAHVRNGTGRTTPVDFIGTGIPGASPDPDEPGWVVPTPASGTACTDTDGDGMPDAWESIVSGSSTGVTADSVSVSGYLMIEHYLNGSDPNDPTPWQPATFGNFRYVYLLPVDTIPFGTDNILVPDTTVIPRNANKVSIYNPAQDSVLTVTCQSFGVSADSVTVDVRSRAWDRQGMRSAAEIRNRSLTALSC